MVWRMIRLLSALIVTLSLACQPVLAQPKVPDFLKRAVVAIYLTTTEPQSGIGRTTYEGSGFLFDKQEGLIITAKHVLKSAAQRNPAVTIRVALGHRNAEPVPASLLRCDDDPVDLCVIIVNPSAVTTSNINRVFALACRTLQPDERLVALGYPSGKNDRLNDNSTRVTSSSYGSDLKQQVEGFFVPGMSGGPIVDNRLRAVAIVTGARTNEKDLKFIQAFVLSDVLAKSKLINCPNMGSAQSLPDLRDLGPCTIITGKVSSLGPCTTSSSMKLVLRERYEPIPDKDAKRASRLNPMVVLRKSTEVDQELKVYFQLPLEGPLGHEPISATYINVYAYQVTPTGRANERPLTVLQGKWEPGDLVEAKIRVPTPYFDERSGWNVRLCIGTGVMCIPSENVLLGAVY